MTRYKTFIVLTAMFGLTYIAAGMNFLASGKTDSRTGENESFSKNVTSYSVPKLVRKAEVTRANPLELLEAEQPENGNGNLTQSDNRKLPGLFRGDWGQAPVYALNDRVNYQDAAYLSLENGNQNQLPTTSSNYWQLLKTFKAADLQACQSPQKGRDLSKCDFSDGVNLKNRDLNGAVLVKARLSGELGSADLTGANLSNAAVIGSLIVGPNTRLENANLSKLQSDGNNPFIAESANMNNTNLIEGNLYGAKMAGANLTAAKMTAATLTGAELNETHMENAELSKANLSYANLTAARLTNADLSDSDLSEANLTDSDFSKANLQQANLAGADLSGSDLSGSDLQGANLAETKNTDHAIVDGQTNFTSAICPDGAAVDGTQVTTCIGHGF